MQLSISMPQYFTLLYTSQTGTLTACKLPKRVVGLLWLLSSEDLNTGSNGTFQRLRSTIFNVLIIDS